MQVTQLIKSSAEVVTITSFRVGDVYKRVDTNYQGEPTLRYGIVEDVMNNGEDAVLSAVEYRASDFGGGIEIGEKVFDGGKPAALYPAQPAELHQHLTRLHEAAATAVKTAERALEQAQEKAKLVAWLDERITAGVTAPQVVRGSLASSGTDDPEAAIE